MVAPMSELLNKIIKDATQEPVKAKRSALSLPQVSLVASAVAQAIEMNGQLPEARRVHPKVIAELVAREEAAASSEGQISRAVMNFVSTLESSDANTPTKHMDLLPPNHPLSTAWISVFRLRKATARYFSADPDLYSRGSEIVSLVASAIEAEPVSARRKFFVAVLRSKTLDPRVFGYINTADEIVARKSV